MAGDGPGTADDASRTADEGSRDDAPPGGATAIDVGRSGDEQDEELTQPIPVQHPPQEQHPG
jgi:hypothetical protein